MKWQLLRIHFWGFKHIQSPSGHRLLGQTLLADAPQAETGQRPGGHQQHDDHEQAHGQHQHGQNGRLFDGHAVN